MPIALIWWAPDPVLYLTYAFVVTENLGKTVTDISQFHSYVMASSVIATVAAAALVGGAKHPWRCLMLVAPCLAAAVWLNGKRSVLAMAIIMMMTGLWLRGRLRGRKMLVAVAVSVLLIASFSYWYQLAVRDIGISVAANSDVYENFRVDYSRDSRVKMAMFAELHPSIVSILEFRGQSLLFYATAYIPRAMWPGKPLPYSCYFTSAMLGSSPQIWGWVMSTSIFDEGIANGSWFGLLAACLIVGVLCRIGDSCADVLVFLLTALVASLLLTEEVIAFAPLVLLWVMMIVRAKVRFA